MAPVSSPPLSSWQLTCRTSARPRNRRSRSPPVSCPADYAALGIPEYWRFNEAPTRSNPALAGDRLVEGEYQPIPIDTLPDGRFRGHSTVLNLILEWQDGQLNWIDPDTEEHIPTFQQDREGRLAERDGRLAEREARLLAEARNRELEAELRRLRGS